MDGYVGEIRMVGFNWAPSDWMLCQGQELSIAQNQALFSLIGTTYGGNGTNIFKLPDLRARSPIGWGSAPGLPSIAMGGAQGAGSVTLGINHMPMHNHGAMANPKATTNAASVMSPESAIPAEANDPTSRSAVAAYAAATEANVQMAPIPVAVTPSGNGESFSIQNPSLGVNFIICVNGEYPSRG
jgi:microcystin-dependent protein